MQTTKFRTVYRSCDLRAVSIVAAAAQGNAHLSIDASMGGAKIDRNLFGRFADNFGRRLCRRIWIGLDPPTLNTRGIRNVVVAAPGALKVPSAHWPGGRFAYQYHKEIGTADKWPGAVSVAAKDASGKLCLKATILNPGKSPQIASAERRLKLG